MKKFRFIPAVCLTLALLLLLQALVMPKYMTESQEGAMIAEYYDFAGGNDVVFIGDCELYENFSPVALWQSSGIPSCIRGSAQQTIWQSYYLMEETFRYEKPKVMVFNVLAMEFATPADTGRAEQREAYNRMTLDGMRWSRSKWNSILASMTDMEKEKGGMLLYLMPLLRYHDRWSDLKLEDFRNIFSRPQLTDNGYLMQVGIKPYTAPHAQRPLVDYSFGESCWQYLDAMRLLCEENGTEFVLVKAPSLSPIWWDQWDAQIEEYANKHGLLYVNCLDYQEEIGLDWSTDTYDTGLHLNVYGAEKLSAWFGQILARECGLEDRRAEAGLAEVWAEKTAVYDERKATLEAQEGR